jgi:predicted acylesterase/phospholipase RssA
LGKKWKIWEAARAATATPFYFRPFELYGRRFTDASVGYNNPSEEVYHEVAMIPEYNDRDIACFVSIGTGVSTHRPAPITFEKDFSQSMLPPFLQPGRTAEKEHSLTEFVAEVASSSQKVDQEMQRVHMRDG